MFAKGNKPNKNKQYTLNITWSHNKTIEQDQISKVIKSKMQSLSSNFNIGPDKDHSEHFYLNIFDKKAFEEFRDKYKYIYTKIGNVDVEIRGQIKSNKTKGVDYTYLPHEKINSEKVHIFFQSNKINVNIVI